MKSRDICEGYEFDQEAFERKKLQTLQIRAWTDKSNADTYEESMALEIIKMKRNLKDLRKKADRSQEELEEFKKECDIQ